MVFLERDRYKRFHFGLHHNIQIYLVAHNRANFDELVEKARAIEEIQIEALQIRMGLEKGMTGQSGQTTKEIANHVTLVEM